MKKKPRKRGLNIRERKFLVAYLSGATGAEAARRAGYSPDTAREQASRLLTKVHIREAVTKALKDRQLSPEEIVAELEMLAKSSIKELWSEKGIIMPNQLPDAVARSVKKFRADPRYGVEIEMHSKLDALNHLAKIKKLFVDRHELTGKDGGPLTMDIARRIIDEIDDGEAK